MHVVYPELRLTSLRHFFRSNDLTFNDHIQSIILKASCVLDFFVSLFLRLYKHSVINQYAQQYPCQIILELWYGSLKLLL